MKGGCDGSVKPYKARLVTKGYAQKYEVNYDETFVPVVRYSSIRTLVAFAIWYDMIIDQMDVITAFLNGTLEEEIYMQQPVGYVPQGKEHIVHKLNKSIYGLKQSLDVRIKHLGTTWDSSSFLRAQQIHVFSSKQEI